MIDARARKLLTLPEAVMTDSEHRAARMLLLQTDWTDAQAACLAIDRLTELTHVPRIMWEVALKPDMERKAS